MGIDDIECSGAIVVGIVTMNATMTHPPNPSADDVRNAWIIVLSPVLNPVRDDLGSTLHNCICRRVARFGTIDGQKHRTSADIPVFQTRAHIGRAGDHIGSIKVISLHRFDYPGVDVIFAASPEFIDRVPKRIRSAGQIPIRMSK